jgi:hypothetical protein
MDTIVLPSGNVTPSLAEQEEYLRLRQERWNKRHPKLKKHYVPAPRRLRRWDVSTSGESTFRQNGYTKKETNTVKQDWRERKGFRRDQAKGRCFCKCKITDTREGHRRWQRDLLHKMIGMEVQAFNDEVDFFDKELSELASYDKDSFTSRWDCC